MKSWFVDINDNTSLPCGHVYLFILFSGEMLSHHVGLHKLSQVFIVGQENNSILWLYGKNCKDTL